ncbi:MAG: hypothetical protein ACLU30_03035 [Odoribacter splanchnicus]
MIIIPEMFNKTQITIDKIVRLIISSMIKRRIVGQKFGVVVVGEGIFHFLQMKILLFRITFDYDAHGHPELSEVSKAHVISKILKTVERTESGYYLSSGRSGVFFEMCGSFGF